MNIEIENIQVLHKLNLNEPNISHCEPTEATLEEAPEQILNEDLFKEVLMADLNCKHINNCEPIEATLEQAPKQILDEGKEVSQHPLQSVQLSEPSRSCP